VILLNKNEHLYLPDSAVPPKRAANMYDSDGIEAKERTDVIVVVCCSHLICYASNGIAHSSRKKPRFMKSRSFFVGISTDSIAESKEANKCR
jgi:hypothetical protein